jgi:His/Glu/Gln/Arg/opine family amino acid ABC transporter permease subunit
MLETLAHELQDWGPRLLAGASVTVLITIVTMALATAWGLILALLRIARLPVLYQAILLYVEVFRGLPTIVVLLFVFFGLPSAGIDLSDNAIVVGIVGLTLSLGAYLSEVFRAAILAVDPGQMEAAISIGMSRGQAYRRIVLPQAFVIAVPTLGGYGIGLLKETSLLAFISVSELLRVGNDIVAATFESFHVYFFVGAMYVILSLLASRLVLIVERRLRPLEKRYTGSDSTDLRPGLPPDMWAA